MTELEDFLIYNFSNQTINQEDLRNKSGIDIENDDRLKKKINFFSKIKFEKKKRKFLKVKFNYLKNKSDTLNLIKNAKNGIKIENFLDSYDNMKKDLINLVKISGRHRKLIIIKGKNDFHLTAFYFHPKTWIFVSHKTVNNWHNPKKINKKNQPI
ncbi:hypothetical protein HAN_2g341 (nucleomorph) [Hemiselmis andersenii]|uniref:Uncharacterized protein n=1 Tax=Hemiselmis andersenii TaxID=464988 RepID=A9BKI7_HEMAN|nr:hypothetical protein HAN_2g341 [Hemiselmis andersenii]ABW98158.1 hypothetical protein HAN_2g341 [Hemiselmis andersenii]|mmetsp:Transcript_35502/g.86462  ORF Transcript_35502/g.86462 Transcript_35502/m.86462 type:complete len:155 (-) Transcript_35502:151-615(-)